MLGEPASPLLWSINGDRPDQRSLASWCAYTGQNEEDVPNWGWLHEVHPADRKNVRATWKHAVDTRHPTTLAYRIHHSRQGYRPFKVLHVPLFDAEHQLQDWFVFFTEEPASPSVIDENWEIRLLHGMIFAQKVLGIFCLSLDGALTRVNDHLCQLTGYTEEELLSMTIWQLNVPEDVKFHLQAMRERLSENQSFPPFRTRYRRKDSRFIWVRTTQFLVRQPTGEPHYFFFVVEDISVQVQAEEERAELLTHAQEAHLEALARTLQLEAVFEAITDGILVSDSKGNIIQTNAATRRLLHLDASPAFLSMSFEERIPLLKAVDENGKPIPLEKWPLSRLLRGEHLRGGREEDIRLILADGQKIYVNHSGAPMRDQNNQIIGAVLVIHDVNERHLLENRIQKSFKILLALAEALVDIPGRCIETPKPEQLETSQLPFTCSFQTTGEYLAELTCQMLEYRGVCICSLDPETELLHLVALAGFAPDEQSFYREKFSRLALADFLDQDPVALLRDNEVVIREFLFHKNDPRPYNVLLAPMIRDGRLVGILTMEKTELLDASYAHEEISLVKAIAKLILLVIERERIQREWIEAHSSELALREANRRFDEFLSIASHELRTPLAGIKGNIQLALRRLTALKSDQITSIEVLVDKLNKMQGYLLQAEHRINVQNRMISDLLDVSRIQANKLELVMSSCDLSKIVYDAVKDQQYDVPERMIMFEAPCDDKFMVVGDADRLSQVVHNYLTNALKYSPPDRPVSVYVEKKGGEVGVSVRDKGPGLTPEEQEHVWERFYRVKGIQAQSGSGPGLGLGLHICRAIIEAHHGKFGLDSTPGNGCTFWFTLPLTQSTVIECEQPSHALGEHISDV